MYRMLHNITFVICIVVFATTAIRILRAAEEINDTAVQPHPRQVPIPVAVAVIPQ